MPAEILYYLFVKTEEEVIYSLRSVLLIFIRKLLLLFFGRFPVVLLVFTYNRI